MTPDAAMGTEDHTPTAADAETVRDAALQLIRKGYFDPGATVPRQFDQGPEKDETEPVWAWGARAAMENLVNAELLSGVTPAAAVVPQEQYDDLEAEYVSLLVPVAKLLGVPAAIPDPNPGNGSEDAPQVWNLDGIEDALAAVRPPRAFRPGDPEPNRDVRVVIGRDKIGRRIPWLRYGGLPGQATTGNWISVEAVVVEWSRIFEAYPVLVEVPLPDYDAAVAADEKAKTAGEQVQE